MAKTLGPHGPLFLFLVLSLGLNWPYLGSGFLADDVILVSAMEEDPLPFSRWRGVWSGDTEDLSWFGNPWWAEPDAMGSFFRPLPSLVLESSLRAFGRTAFPLHLLAVLLHGAIGYLLFLLVRSLSPRRGLPALAGLTYLVCEDHSMTVGFLSFITDVFCVFFIALSLVCHLVWLEHRKARSLIAALLTLIVALGCKETAAVGPLALVVTTFLFPRGRAASAAAGLRRHGAVFLRDPLSWVPAVVILVVFLGLYSAFGLGGMDNLSYVDPLRNPLRYLSHLVIHLPVMWLATLSPVPPSLGFYAPDVFLPMAAAGLVAFLLFLWALRPHRREALVAWALGLYLLALLPQLGTDAGERLLYFPYLFGSVLVARLVLDVPPLARRFASDGTNSTPRWTRITGWYLLGGVILTGAVLSAILSPSYVRWARPWTSDPLTAVPHITPAVQDIIILNARDFSALLMVPTILENEVGRALDVHLLSATAGRPEVERSGESSFILRLDRRGWLTNFMARAFRRREELRPGEVYPGTLFDATLLVTTEDRREALAVRFEMHQPLGDPGLLFLAWTGRDFQTIDLAALAIGESMPLAPKRR